MLLNVQNLILFSRCFSFIFFKKLSVFFNCYDFFAAMDTSEGKATSTSLLAMNRSVFPKSFYFVFFRTSGLMFGLFVIFSENLQEKFAN